MNLLILVLMIILIYLLIIEYIGYIPNHSRTYNLEDFKVKEIEYKSEPKFPPVTYKEDYKPKLNEELNYAFVPYYDMIKRDILPENNFSLSQELTHQEMDEYLLFIKEKINNKIKKKKL